MTSQLNDCLKRSINPIDSTPATRDETRERILGAARQLFADKGFDGTSIRAIATAANVNVAAINYHFRSKENLYTELFISRIRPINEHRMRLLDSAERRAEGEAAAFREIVEAFVRPLFESATDAAGRETLRLIARNYHSPPPFIVPAMAREFDPVIKRFVRSLRTALPDLPQDELLWRLLMMSGSVLFVASHIADLQDFTHGVCRTDDTETLVRRLVAFGTAGLTQPTV